MFWQKGKSWQHSKPDQICECTTCQLTKKLPPGNFIVLHAPPPPPQLKINKVWNYKAQQSLSQCKVLKNSLKALIHEPFQPCGWGGLSKPDLKWIVHQQSHMVDGSKIGALVPTCLFQIQHAIFQTADKHPHHTQRSICHLDLRDGQRSHGMVTHK